jgi:hypothetical protein
MKTWSAGVGDSRRFTEGEGDWLSIGGEEEAPR